jgi:Transposase zinc-binding domain
VTGTTRLRSRVKGNFHARFCSRDGGSDSPVDCNRTGGQRCFLAQWHSQRSVVVLPPPLSASVGRTRIGGGGGAGRGMKAMAQVTVQQILQEGDTAFERSHPLPGDVRKAVWALLACRTAVWGGHIQACPEGHVERVWDHSCRHRLCPQCSWLQMERWLARQQARLLACAHDHVMCTIPSARHDLWLANVAVMTTLLCARVRDTWLE